MLSKQEKMKKLRAASERVLNRQITRGAAEPIPGTRRGDILEAVQLKPGITKAEVREYLIELGDTNVNSIHASVNTLATQGYIRKERIAHPDGHGGFVHALFAV